MSNIIARLSRYGACDVADALLRLNHPAGGFLSGLKLRAPTPDGKFVGRAHTIRFKPNTTAPPKRNFTGHYVSASVITLTQIDSVTPGCVLFLSAPPNIPNAVYGGLMTMRARTLGAVGTVVDGRIRDVGEHRAFDYPVFSRDIGITAGHEVCYSSDINVPVQLHSPYQPGVWIHPGDIIVGDENGVACIPQALEEHVASIMPAIVERDQGCLEALRAGVSGEDAFKTRAK